MAITFDESSFPIIRVEMAGACSDQEYDAYHATMTSLLRKAASSGVKMGVVIDARASQPPTPKQRKRMAFIWRVLTSSSGDLPPICRSAAARGGPSCSRAQSSEAC